MTDFLMQLMADYGLVILSASILLACLAIPLPSSILMVLSGAFVGSGDLDMTQVLLVAFISAVIGDQIAYGVGSLGGNALERRFANSPKHQKSIEKAKDFSAKWGSVGVFLSRWLVAPIGPWINFASGMGDFSWHRFTIWAVLGEVIWVGLYVMLGFLFSDNAFALADLLANTSWALIGILILFFMGKHLNKAANKPVQKQQ